MEEGYKYVEWILIGLGLIFVIIEIVLNLNDEQNDTTNAILYEYARGKFFLSPYGVIAFFLIAMLLGVLGQKFPDNFVVSTYAQVALLLSGMLFAFLIWPQYEDADAKSNKK